MTRTSDGKEIVTISDGRKITINPYLITLEEYRAVFSKKQDPAEEDVIMARVFGLELDDYHSLPHPDWRKLLATFVKLTTGPLDDPNLASESTST